MLRKFRDVALLALLMAAPFAWQASAQLPANVRFGTTLPAGCSPSSRTRVLFYKTGATPGLYQCLALNTWTAVGGGGGVTVGTTTSTGTNLTYLKTVSGVVQSSIATESATGTINLPSDQALNIAGLSAVAHNSSSGFLSLNQGAVGAQTRIYGQAVFLGSSLTTYVDNLTGGKLLFDVTNVAGGTTGAATINKVSFSVNFAAAATSLVVTNSTIVATSYVLCTVQTNDSTALLKNATPAAGSVTIRLNAAATAETRVACLVVN